MSHTVYVEFKCLEGKGPDFLDVLLPALSDTRAFSTYVETFVNMEATDTLF